MQQLTRFQLTRASRGPSAIDEPFVYLPIQRALKGSRTKKENIHYEQKTTMTSLSTVSIILALSSVECGT